MSILILSILKVSEKGNRLYCMNYLGNTDILKGFLWTFVIVCLNYSNDLGISFTKSVHGRKCWAWWGQGLFNLISDDTEVFFWVTHKSSELARKIWVATPKSPRPTQEHWVLKSHWIVNLLTSWCGGNSSIGSSHGHS